MTPLNKIVWFCFFVLLSTGVRAEMFLPPEGQTLFVLGQDKASIRDYTKVAQKDPAGIMLYTSIQRAEGLTAESDNGAGIQFGDFYTARYKNSVIQLAVYMVGVLPDVPTGKFDKQIRSIGQWIQKSQRPVYVRLGYEFDLPANHYKPDEYKKAYTYIVDQWRAMGVTNAAYVWHTYAMLDVDRPIADWYPGDDYVDWIAMSYFVNEQRRDGQAVAHMAASRGKGFMIAEATPRGIYTDRGKENWLTGLENFIQMNNVKILSYIHTDWEQWPLFRGDTWGDSRWTADQQRWAIWKNFVNAKHMRHADKKLFQSLGYSQEELN